MRAFASVKSRPNMLGMRSLADCEMKRSTCSRPNVVGHHVGCVGQVAGRQRAELPLELINLLSRKGLALVALSRSMGEPVH
jgi:hypothetical protein